jgi:hypothetical protein
VPTAARRPPSSPSSPREISGRGNVALRVNHPRPSPSMKVVWLGTRARVIPPETSGRYEPSHGYTQQSSRAPLGLERAQRTPGRAARARSYTPRGCTAESRHSQPAPFPERPYRQKGALSAPVVRLLGKEQSRKASNRRVGGPRAPGKMGLLEMCCASR